MSEFDRYAQNGAALLDRIKPGWHGLVDTNTLNVENPHYCMCAQVFAEEARKDGSHSGYHYFLDNARGFGIHGDVFMVLRNLGFLACGFNDEVTAAWKKEIQKRKEGVGARTEEVAEPYTLAA